MEAIIASGFLSRRNAAIRLVIEGLLAHFFSQDRPSYSSDDAVWFLELANQQTQWCFKINEEENVGKKLAAKTCVSC